MLEKKSLIVLDIDDTLCKSENQHQKAFVETMEHFGITKINSDWGSYMHMTDSFILKENFEANLPEIFQLDFIRNFEVVMTQKLKDLEPVSEIIGAAQAIKHFHSWSEYGLCFATGSLLQPALIKLQQANIEINGSPIFGSNKYLSREEIVSAAIQSAKQRYQVSEFSQIISVGDGIWDWKTAQNLNLDFIGIGKKNLNHFKAVGLKHHIMDWSELGLKPSPINLENY